MSFKSCFPLTVFNNKTVLHCTGECRPARDTRSSKAGSHEGELWAESEASSTWHVESGQGTGARGSCKSAQTPKGNHGVHKTKPENARFHGGRDSKLWTMKAPGSRSQNEQPTHMRSGLSHKACGENGAEPTEVPSTEAGNSSRSNDHSLAHRALLRCLRSVSFHS